MSKNHLSFISTQHFLVICLLSILNLEVFHVSCRELTHPLAESQKESPLLKSRKRILPIREVHQGDHHEGHRARPSLLGQDELHQDFVSDKLKIALDCKQDSMRLHLNFTEPFRGVISVGRPNYSNPAEAHHCSIRGSGNGRYRLDVSHLKCQTKFDSKCGQFTNTLFVRYHPSLETGGDYTKTLVCKFGLSSFSVN